MRHLKKIIFIIIIIWQEITTSPKLEELNIGYNALYDMCGSSLANILLTCSQLNSLQLQSCYLTNKIIEPAKPLAEALKGNVDDYAINSSPYYCQGIEAIRISQPTT